MATTHIWRKYTNRDPDGRLPCENKGGGNELLLPRLLPERGPNGAKGVCAEVSARSTNFPDPSVADKEMADNANWARAQTDFASMVIRPRQGALMIPNTAI